MKVELVHDNLLNVSMLGTSFSSSDSTSPVNVYKDGYVDFLLDKEAYVRYGNKSRARIEIRYGETKDLVSPVRIFVDYLKTPQQMTLQEE